MKDHLKSKKHATKKEVLGKLRTVLPTLLQPAGNDTRHGCKIKTDLQAELVLDYVNMCTVADIPLEKTGKMCPFLEKH